MTKWEECKYYWRSFRSAFIRIKAYSDEGLPAFNKLLSTLGEGVNPMTGLPSGLGLSRLLPISEQLYSRKKEKRVLAFCDCGRWWVSSNSGYSWAIMPDEKVFLKIVHLVDIVL